VTSRAGLPRRRGSGTTTRPRVQHRLARSSRTGEALPEALTQNTKQGLCRPPWPRCHMARAWGRRRATIRCTTCCAGQPRAAVRGPLAQVSGELLGAVWSAGHREPCPGRCWRPSSCISAPTPRRARGSLTATAPPGRTPVRLCWPAASDAQRPTRSGQHPPAATQLQQQAAPTLLVSAATYALIGRTKSRARVWNSSLMGAPSGSVVRDPQPLAGAGRASPRGCTAPEFACGPHARTGS